MPKLWINMDLYDLQIFLDIAVLVEAQGELLDNIETQVGSFTSLNHALPFSKFLHEAAWQNFKLPNIRYRYVLDNLWSCGYRT